MRWEKLGLIFKPGGEFDWMQSHASMPSALQLKDNIYRIYFATRCKKQQSRIAFIEVDITEPKIILGLSSAPALSIGSPGFFDDSGVFAGNILTQRDGQLRMYYSGRNNGQHPLYYMSIGLATGHRSETLFNRVFSYPIISRNKVNPWMVSTPFVLEENDRFHMFYLSGVGWSGDLTKSFYDIKYAYSSDGINWNFNANSIIPLRKDETNIAAPSVVKWNDMYLMFYSYVKKPLHYKIGWAFSKNLTNWERLEDPKGLDLGPEFWDSESMAYPHAFIHNSELYLLYSGNKNGLGGMGLAKYVAS